jgi:membrane protein involved in D-alanine export
MTPYATFTYFAFLLYPGLPAIWLGLTGRLTRTIVLVMTLLMLALQYGALLPLDAAIPALHAGMVLLYAGYTGGLVMGFAWLKRRSLSRRWVSYVVVAAALAPLGAAKLLPVFGRPGLWGFLGISYLTFRTLDVLFGIQDGLIKSIRLKDFWLFLLFFPTIASGPIDRFRRFQKDWEQPRSRVEYLADLDGAVQRIFRGFLYKFILAYLIQRYWMEPVGARTWIYASLQPWQSTLLYMYAYSLYLFFDFAGYSAFAIGVSYLFGVRTPENFDRPFLSQNIREFWNRWHISLSHWFRDHVYMRFVMAVTRAGWFKQKYVTSALGLLFSMGLMGIWHGLQAHYIIYGLYHAGLLIGFDYLSRWNKRTRLWGNGPLWRWAGILITFHAVCFGLLIFSGKLF